MTIYMAIAQCKSASILEPLQAVMSPSALFQYPICIDIEKALVELK